MESVNEVRIEEHDGSLPTVLMIVGSLRKKSFNRQLAQFAADELADRANVRTLDWREVPVFNQDEEFPTSEPVASARTEVADADAIWIVTPNTTTACRERSRICSIGCRGRHRTARRRRSSAR